MWMLIVLSWNKISAPNVLIFLNLLYLWHFSKTNTSWWVFVVAIASAVDNRNHFIFKISKWFLWFSMFYAQHTFIICCVEWFYMNAACFSQKATLSIFSSFYLIFLFLQLKFCCDGAVYSWYSNIKTAR